MLGARWECPALRTLCRCITYECGNIVCSADPPLPNGQRLLSRRGTAPVARDGPALPTAPVAPRARHPRARNVSRIPDRVPELAAASLRTVWNHFQYSSSLSEPIRAGRRRIRRLRAGTRSCGPGPPVYDYRGRGAPSHCLGRIHPYVRSCSATGTDRERPGSDWRTRIGAGWMRGR